MKNHIIYRFGTPETITTYQGSMFIGRKMVEFAPETRFKSLTSTPYYAQAMTNTIIIGLVKKHLGQKPKNWHKMLDQVLWACQNSPDESTNYTSFQLTYGYNAILYVEIYLRSAKIQSQIEIPTEYYWV